MLKLIKNSKPHTSAKGGSASGGKAWGIYKKIIPQTSVWGAFLTNPMLKRLPLVIEITASVAALATENYWFFLIALIGGIMDLISYFRRSN